jgi:hypothetical protein
VLFIGFTMGAALLAMSGGMMLAGVEVDPAALVTFTALTAFSWRLLSIVAGHISEQVGWEW